MRRMQAPSRVESFWRAARMSRKDSKPQLPARRYVDALYTFGAPPAGLIKDHSRSNECFKGGRFWLFQNELGVPTVDHAPGGMSLIHDHGNIDSVGLSSNGRGEWIKCSNASDEARERPGPWAQNWYQTWPMWAYQVLRNISNREWNKAILNTNNSLHSSELYTKWIRNSDIFLKEKFVEEKQTDVASVAMVMSEAAYFDECRNVSTKLSFHGFASNHTWRLVEWYRIDEVSTAGKDTVSLIQNDALDCVLTLQGTDDYYQRWENRSNYEMCKTRFCGFDINVGYARQFLQQIYSPRWSAVKEKLAHCRTVNVAGHSLGGSIATIFSGCANAGSRISDMGDSNEIADFSERLRWNNAQNASKIPTFDCSKPRKRYKVIEHERDYRHVFEYFRSFVQFWNFCGKPKNYIVRKPNFTEYDPSTAPKPQSHGRR